MTLTEPRSAPPEPEPDEPALQTQIAQAVELFLAHVLAHSPDKPEIVRRYRKALDHFQRQFGHRRFVEAISRADVHEFKIRRCQEKSERHDRLISATTVDFEAGTLRTFL